MNIGKSVVIKGELSGSEDLTIEGQVEGKIELRQNLLTIGPNAKIKAQVFAKTVVVEGQVHGNISAGERIDIRDKGVVEGNLVGAARRDCGRRALPRAASTCRAAKAESPAAEAKPVASSLPQPAGAAPSVAAR